MTTVTVKISTRENADLFYASLVRALGTMADKNFLYTVDVEESDAGTSNH